MQKTVKYLQNLRGAREDFNLDNSSINEAIIEAQNAEHYINEIEFTIECFKTLQAYLKMQAVVVLPENISAESDLKEMLESRDDISWNDIGPLKKQIDDLLEANEKAKRDE